MALAQRQIRVSRADIPVNRQRRKHIPSIIATLGDYIQAKGYEKGLHPYQIADKMGIAASLVSAWESGKSTPDKTQLQMLRDLLSFDSGVDLALRRHILNDLPVGAVGPFKVACSACGKYYWPDEREEHFEKDCAPNKPQ